MGTRLALAWGLRDQQSVPYIGYPKTLNALAVLDVAQRELISLVAGYDESASSETYR